MQKSLLLKYGQATKKHFELVFRICFLGKKFIIAKLTDWRIKTKWKEARLFEFVFYKFIFFWKLFLFIVHFLQQKLVNWMGKKLNFVTTPLSSSISVCFNDIYFRIECSGEVTQLTVTKQLSTLIWPTSWEQWIIFDVLVANVFVLVTLLLYSRVRRIAEYKRRKQIHSGCQVSSVCMFCMYLCACCVCMWRHKCMVTNSLCLWTENSYLQCFRSDYAHIFMNLSHITIDSRPFHAVSPHFAHLVSFLLLASTCATVSSWVFVFFIRFIYYSTYIWYSMCAFSISWSLNIKSCRQAVSMRSIMLSSCRQQTLSFNTNVFYGTVAWPMKVLLCAVNTCTDVFIWVCDRINELLFPSSLNKSRSK